MKSKWKVIWVILGVLIVLTTIFCLFRHNLTAEGMFRGGDEAAHMFIPKFSMDYLLEHGKLPVINPYWYNGIETLHSAPPLDYIPISLIYLLTKNIYLTDRIFTLFLLLLAGYLMFFFLYKKTNIRSAIIGGVLYPFSISIFYLTRTSVTRATPLILLPIGLYFTEALLEEDFKWSNLFWLMIIFACMILSHPITGVSSLLFYSIYAVGRLVFDRKVKSKNFLTWFGGFLLACGLTAWFAVPFLLEPAGYTYPASSFTSFILGNKIRETVVNLGGIVIVFLGLFSFWRNRNAKNWALFASVVIAYASLTPLALPVYNIFPWGFPYAALAWISVVFFYWFTTALEFPKLPQKIRYTIGLVSVPLIIIVGLIGFNKMSLFNRTWVERFDNVFADLQTAFKENQSAGRVMTIKNIDKLDWIVPAVAQKYYSEGHYFSITRLNHEIAWINDAFNEGYFDYFFSRMNLFNDRYFIETSYLSKFLENNPDLKTPYLTALAKYGFQSIFTKPVENQTMVDIGGLYFNSSPSTYLMAMDKKTLVIGQYGYNYAAFQPNCYLGGSNNIDDYDLDFLKNFDNLVLYGFGFKNKDQAEKMVREYAESGGHVIIDMLNMQISKLESEGVFLGVQSNQEVTKVPMELEVTAGQSLPTLLEIPSTKKFGPNELEAVKSQPLNEWRFTDYYNLDGTLVSWQNNPDPEKNLYGLVGYKSVGENKVWFVGGNLIYHAYLTHNEQEQKFLSDLSATLTQSSSGPISFSNENLDPEGGKIEFSYQTSLSQPALISYTISPHWKAYVDGQPAKIYNIDSMMALNLPAGDHRVTLKYETLADHAFARAMTLATIGFVIILFIKTRRKRANVQK